MSQYQPQVGLGSVGACTGTAEPVPDDTWQVPAGMQQPLRTLRASHLAFICMRLVKEQEEGANHCFTYERVLDWCLSSIGSIISHLAPLRQMENVHVNCAED
jgi:hypothetical protein